MTECTECENEDGITFPYETAADGTNYEAVTCRFAGVCPDSVTRNSCQWQRYFFFGCANSGSMAEFSIATNSLPNHCYYNQITAPIGSSDTFNVYYYTALFNLPIGEMDDFTEQPRGTKVTDYVYSIFETQTDVNTLCDSNWARSQYLDLAYNYAEFVGDEDYTNDDVWDATGVNGLPYLQLSNSD